MHEWHGATGICVNDHNELLMVLQGTPDETKTWSVPSGGLEEGETIPECCLREIEEETGYNAEIVETIKVKNRKYEKLNIWFVVHYFKVTIIRGERTIQDPDRLIHKIEWKSVEQIDKLKLTYPEDREFLMNYIKEC